MKFYVIGSKFNNINIRRKDAYHCSDDLEEAYGVYVATCQNKVFKNCFLIADFEIHKPRLLKSISFENSKDPLPFLVIAEYDIKYGSMMRSDNLILYGDGFSREFSTNYRAVEEFVKFYKDNINATLDIVYNESANKTCRREIANTIQMMILDKPYPVRKFKFNTPIVWTHVEKVKSSLPFSVQLAKQCGKG